MMSNEEKEAILKGIESMLKSRVYGNVSLIDANKDTFKLSIKSVHMLLYYSKTIEAAELIRICQGEYSVRLFVEEIIEDYKKFIIGCFVRGI